MYALISSALAFLAAGTLTTTSMSMLLIRGSSAAVVRASLFTLPSIDAGPTTLLDGHQVHDYYVLRTTI
jgi:hypothetical protein